MYSDVGASGAALNTGEAVSIINAYRRNRGLGPLAADPALMAVAQGHSQTMADNDKVGRSGESKFTARMREAGVQPDTARVNVGAGYRTIAQAFSGWRGSPDHDKTMLLADGRRMGIAAVYAPRSKYRVFWTLIVAE